MNIGLTKVDWNLIEQWQLDFHLEKKRTKCDKKFLLILSTNKDKYRNLKNIYEKLLLNITKWATYFVYKLICE